MSARTILWLALVATAVSNGPRRASGVEPPRIILETLPDHRVRLGWENTGQSVILEEASTLTPPVPWQTARESVTLDGSRFSAVLSFGDTGRFFRLNDQGPGLTTFSSSPASGETGIAVTRETILTFNQPLAADTLLTTTNLYAEFAGRKILSRVELSSDRRKATLFYLENLPASARIRVTFDASTVHDDFARLVDADGDRTPGGVGTIEFDTLGITPVAATAIIGRVFASELVPNPTNAALSVNQPLPGVTITVDGAEETLRTTTDANGFFRLQPCPSGRFFVHVDGRTVTNLAAGIRYPDQSYYPFVGKAWEAAAGQTNNLAAGTGEIFLPLIMAGTSQPVSATADTTITFPPEVIAANPALDGVFIMVPANSLFSDNGTRGGRVGIAPVPPDRLPEPLPPGLEMPIVITVQTDGGLNFDRPASVCFPNLPDPVLKTPLPAGSKQALISFNHDKGVWEAVGSMSVTLDGRFVISDPGTGIRQPGWHGVAPPPSTPPPPPCESCCYGGAGGGPLAAPTLRPAGNETAKQRCLRRCEEDLKRDLFTHLTEYLIAVAGCSLTGPAVEACLAPITAAYLYSMHGDFETADICRSRCKEDCADQQSGGAGLAPTVVDAALEIAPEDEVSTLVRQINALLYPYLMSGQPIPEGVMTQVRSLLEQADSITGGNGIAYMQNLVLQIEEFESLAEAQSGEAFGNAPGYPVHYLAEIASADGSVLRLRGETAPFGQYSIFVPRDGTIRYVSFYDPKTKAYGITYPRMRPQAQYRLRRFTLVPVDSSFPDTDLDGLPDAVEFVYGTSAALPDSDGDGIPDGAEVEQRTNPLDGRPAATGIIASVDTAGTALDVAALNNVAVVADGAGGVVVFDASNPFQPVQAAVIPTVAPATSVAIGPAFAVVAQGNAGIAVLDVRNSRTARKLYDLPLNGSARAVALHGNTAYVGLDNGQVVAVDIPSAAIVGRLTVAARVDDLAVKGEHLFVVTATQLQRYHRGEELVSAGVVPLSYEADGNTQRRRISVGTTNVLVTSWPGFDVVDVRNPNALQVIAVAVDNGTFNSFKQIVENGSGLGVAAAGVRQITDGTQHIQLYDRSTASNTSGYLTTFMTPGESRAVSIFNGLAYVADGSAGLQVVNYRAYDSLGVAPTIALSALLPFSTPTAEIAESGQPFSVTAAVGDDVQVRNVEFFIDGQLAVTDGNFPFEQVLFAPILTAGKTAFTLRAKATDTGGNSTLSPEIVVQLAADLTVPRIVSRYPKANTVAGTANAILVQFGEPLNAATIGPGGFFVTWAGNDELWGTGDDALVTSGTFSYRTDENAAVFSFTAPLNAGVYRVVVGSPLADLAGNLVATTSWTFIVLGAADSDQDGVPDALEVALGFDPNNPDSDGDGILDGDEDQDGDGLTTRWELLLGHSPTNPDSDGDGISDGLEDFDGDTLSNQYELALGTSPKSADTDGDGWNDEAEITAGSSPTNPASRPTRIFLAAPSSELRLPRMDFTGGLPLNVTVAQPTIGLSLPRLDSTGGLPLNVTVARPPIGLTLPRLDSTGGLPWNTTLASPPISIMLPILANPGAPWNVTLGQPTVQLEWGP